MPTIAARCVGPESLPMKVAHSDNTDAEPNTLSRPARLCERGPQAAHSRSHNGRSPSPPIASSTMFSNWRSSAVPTTANRSAGHAVADGRSRADTNQQLIRPHAEVVQETAARCAIRVGGLPAGNRAAHRCSRPRRRCGAGAGPRARQAPDCRQPAPATPGAGPRTAPCPKHAPEDRGVDTQLPSRARWRQRENVSKSHRSRRRSASATLRYRSAADAGLDDVKIRVLEPSGFL